MNKHTQPELASDVTERFITAFNTLGNSNYRKHIGLIRVLHLFGKLDEVADMIEQYKAYVEKLDNKDEIVLLPFFPGEFTASDEETFINQTNLKGNDNDK